MRVGVLFVCFDNGICDLFLFICTALNFVYIRGGHFVTHCNTLQRTLQHCNTLQRTLQHTATHVYIRGGHFVTHCNTLQRTLQHTAALQHTATHTATHCNARVNTRTFHDSLAFLLERNSSFFWTAVFVLILVRVHGNFTTHLQCVAVCCSVEPGVRAGTFHDSFAECCSVSTFVCLR